MTTDAHVVSMSKAEVSVTAAESSSSLQGWNISSPEMCRDDKNIPLVTVEDPPDVFPSPPSGSGINGSSSGALVSRSSIPVVESRNGMSGRSSATGPMSVALDGPNPSPHFVSLENIARLYIELKNDRDYLVQESSRIFTERVSVVRDLRELEAHLNELMQRKARLEENLDQLGLRDEENRAKMAEVDDKVANIAFESQRFEALVRELKAGSSPTSLSNKSVAPVRNGESLSINANVVRLPQSSACRRTLYGHTGTVLSLDSCKANNVVISASSDRSLRTWDVATGRRLDTLYGHEGWVHTAAFSPTGERAASGSGDKTIRIWDLSDSRGRGSCKAVLTGHDAGVTCIQLDSNILVSGSLDKTLRRYDLNDGSSFANCTVIQGHDQGVYCLQFVRNGLASGGGDHLIRMHDMRTGVCHRTLAGHSGGAVRALQFDDVQLVSGGVDMTLRFWDLRTGGCVAAVDTGTRINAIKVAHGCVIVACSDHSVKIYDYESKSLLEEHGGHLGPVLSLTGVDSTFFSGGSDQTVRSWHFPRNESTQSAVNE